MMPKEKKPKIYLVFLKKLDWDTLVVKLSLPKLFPRRLPEEGPEDQKNLKKGM